MFLGEGGAAGRGGEGFLACGSPRADSVSDGVREGPISTAFVH